MATVGTLYLDQALTKIKNEATHININTSPEVTTYSAATSGSTFLGAKNFGAGLVFPNAIANGSPNGRQLDTAAVTDGLISASGTAATFSITDNTNGRLIITGTLLSSQAVTANNPFTLASFTVRLPSS